MTDYAILFAQILAIYNSEYFAQNQKFAKGDLKLCQMLNKPSKIA